MKPNCLIYYFATNSEDTNMINEIDTRHKVELRWYIGETMSNMMRNKSCPLELVRIADRPNNFEYVAMRRINDIKLRVYDNRIVRKN